MSQSAVPLLSGIDPPPVRIVNPDGTSPFLLIGDHAGNAVPASLGELGLEQADLTRHIGWDIGIGALGAAMAAAMDAVFIRQSYSRLVIDCNRSTAQPDAIAAISDGSPIPSNADLTDEDRAARFAEIHEPYHKAIDAEVARRDAARQETILLALHSFTPVMRDIARPWHVGILHSDGDPAYAIALLAELRAETALTVGDNEPYRMDRIDYTIPRHAFPQRRRYAEIEVRQDLLGTGEQIAEWVGRLAAAARRAAER